VQGSGLLGCSSIIALTLPPVEDEDVVQVVDTDALAHRRFDRPLQKREQER
jgi:predicted ABC-type ATPase